MRLLGTLASTKNLPSLVVEVDFFCLVEFVEISSNLSFDEIGALGKITQLVQQLEGCKIGTPYEGRFSCSQICDNSSKTIESLFRKTIISD